jgi:pSer/pThr/pTyr-binding forkhead associated (FHA) protein
MSYLKLRDVKSGQVHEFDRELVRAGRDPDLELPVSGDAARVVSAHHAQFAFKNNAWLIEDLGSSNGTYLDEKRMSPGSPQALAVGHVVGFGEGGPRFVVDAVQKKMAPKTVIEIPGSRHVRPSAATEKMQGLADLVPPPPAKSAPPPPAVEPPAKGGGRVVRPSAPTERMRGLDADAAVAAAHAAHTAPPQPIPADAPLPPPLPPPPPRGSHAPPPPPAPAPPRAAAPPKPAPEAPPAREAPAATTVSPAHEGRAAGPFVSLILRELRNKQTFTVRGGRIRIGRGDECELRPVASGDTSVSRIHAEIVLKPDGSVVVRDAGSRNGTFVDGQRVQTEIAIKRGDIILLGEGGPELRIDELTAPGAPAAPAAAPPPPPDKPVPGSRRSFGGKGATAFMRELVVETTRKSSSKMRWVIWSFVGALALLVAAGWFYMDQQAQRTSAALAEQRKLFTSAQATADSLRTTNQAELTRLQHAMDSASGSSAPAAVLDSFRRALGEQQRQAANLGASLERAQSALSQAATAGDSLRRIAQRDQARLQAQLDKATQNSGGVSSAELERLQQRVAAAAARADSIELRLHAVRGVDLPAVAQANQGAVGLITAFFKNGAFDGTGFVITASGYMITNRHVAAEGGQPDSIQVQMADQKFLLTADVVSVAPAGGPDVAVLKVRSYSGPHVAHIDWADTSVRQGAPGVLIGFPAGLRMALDNEAVARTTVSAGTFMSSREDEIRFQGFTVGGSSGSPVFNADGALVALHRAGMLDAEGHLAVGMGIEVPIRKLIPFLPAEAKTELGIR